jgi:IS605 OrfB family transposase
MIKRTVQCSLNEATGFKKDKLDAFFEEYCRVVDCFIELYWNGRPYPQKANSAEYKQVSSWLLGKAMKCAVNQAIKIIKSVKKKDQQKSYQKYKRIFFKCKKKNRNIFGILDKKYADWIVGRRLKHRINKPIFNGSTIELNSDLIRIQDGNNSFDLWIRIGSVFGNRFSLILPSRKHKHYNKMIREGYEQCSSATLYKNGENYFVNIFFEKEELSKSSSRTKCLGIDIGINKLISLSDGRFIGIDFKRLLKKLENRKQKSHNYNQTLKEIKDYIGWCINQIGIENYDLIVIEELKSITKNGKKLSKSKWLRRKLAHWNIDLLHRRLMDKCENSRAYLTTVPACYTSQRCSHCGEIHKESRKGERYECVSCGCTLDADTNASINILNSFLNGESAVSHSIEKEKTNEI